MLHPSQVLHKLKKNPKRPQEQLLKSNKSLPLNQQLSKEFQLLLRMMRRTDNLNQNGPLCSSSTTVSNISYKSSWTSKSPTINNQTQPLNLSTLLSY